MIISRLCTEWTRRLGSKPSNMDRNVVFHSRVGRNTYKCDNCKKSGHTKSRCWSKGGGQEGQCPEWLKGKENNKSNHALKAATVMHIVWAYGHSSESQHKAWYADSAATIHIFTNKDKFSTYREYLNKQVIRMFGKNEVLGIGEGSIDAEVKFQGKITKIKLKNFIHIPDRDDNILSLKILVQKGFES